MKLYIRFVGPQYYPLGGVDDFEGAFETYQEARTAPLNGKREADWIEIALYDPFNGKFERQGSWNREVWDLPDEGLSDDPDNP